MRAVTSSKPNQFPTTHRSITIRLVRNMIAFRLTRLVRTIQMSPALTKLIKNAVFPILERLKTIPTTMRASPIRNNILRLNIKLSKPISMFLNPFTLFFDRSMRSNAVPAAAHIDK